MRALILPFIMWVGVLQLPLPAPLAPETAAALLTAASALAGLTVMVYRLGVWRQEMYNTKHNIGAEVARCRQETAESFARLEARFVPIDKFIAWATEDRVANVGRQARCDATLESHERGIAAVSQRVDRLEHTEAYES